MSKRRLTEEERMEERKKDSRYIGNINNPDAGGWWVALAVVGTLVGIYFLLRAI